MLTSSLPSSARAPTQPTQALVVLICIRTVLVRVGLVHETHADNGVPKPMSSQDLQYLREDLLWGIAFGENFNMVWRANDYFADTSKPYPPPRIRSYLRYP